MTGQIRPSDEDIYTEAEDYLLEEEYNEALPLYLMLLEKGYNTANIKYKIGECYLHVPGQKLKALPYLEEASKEISKKYRGIKLEEDKAPISSIFLLAVAYRLNNKFDKAIEAFNIMKGYMHPDDVENQKIIDIHISRCNNALEMINAPVNIKETRLDNIINSQFSNYNPLLSADESVLVYMDKLKFYDAVMQATNNDGFWSKPVNLTPRIKSDGEFYVVGISGDGTQLLFNSFDAETNGDIYESVLEDRKWSKIKKLNSFVNTEYNETHASLSNDGDVLYFTSNRKGGSGGMDIYKSEKDTNGNWNSAINLGPVINTPFNEESPFVTTDGRRIFFSSQGHYNMGGYDLFTSELSESGEWMPPVNTGFPLNTTDDDLFFYPIGDGTKGYHARFTGNENNDQDIFKYEIFSVANPQKFKISGIVETPGNIDYELNTVSVSFIGPGDNDTIINIYCDNEGKYEHTVTAGEFELTFSTKGKQFDSKRISIPLNFPEEELIVNTILEIQAVIEKDTFLIDDIFFDFDSYSLDKDVLAFLDNLAQLLMKYPGILAIINGFTDSVGSSEYNQLLSVKRAESVGGCLLNFGVDSARLEINGFGEAKPKALNSSPEGRSINRRSEIELTDPENYFIYIHSFTVPDNLATE